MKVNNRSTCTIFILILVTCLSCARNIREQHYATENARFNLLISGVTSEFKEGIISRLVERYNEDANIDLVALDKLDEVQCRDYDAIVIMDSRTASTLLNTTLKSFLEKTEPCKNIVLLFTAGDPDWKYQFHGLDAVTSASLVENENRVYNELTYKIDLILSQSRNS